MILAKAIEIQKENCGQAVLFLEIIKLESRTKILTLILCTKDAMDTKILKARNKW